MADGNLAGIQEATKKKVDLDGFDESENSAVCIAASAGRADVVHALLQAGAKVDLPNGAGTTPLMLAAEDGQLELVDILIAAHADLGARESKAGQTPLMAGPSADTTRW